jgi:hypothetical protein
MLICKCFFTEKRKAHSTAGDAAGTDVHYFSGGGLKKVKSRCYRFQMHEPVPPLPLKIAFNTISYSIRKKIITIFLMVFFTKTKVGAFKADRQLGPEVRCYSNS